MALCFSINATTLPQHHHGKVNYRSNKKCLESVRNLVKKTRVASVVSAPQESLQKGNWVKLICGASFEDVVDVRNLSLVYTLAGVDCIDCAADASIVNAVNEGIGAAREIVYLRKPWVMISVNDDEDLHFRKAEFDPEECPLDCSRPCETICPASAISLQQHQSTTELSHGTETLNVLKGGVITERCYGCGRCFPVCPYDKIRMAMYTRDAAATAELLKRNDVDAIEIHTGGRQTAPFEGLWNDLGNSTGYLKLVAVSLPYAGDSTISSMNTIYTMMEPHLPCLNLWQLDGRPMSGDIGRGATRESIAFAACLAAVKDKPRGFFQLAGGTNAHTVEGLKKEGLFQTTLIAENSKDNRPMPTSLASSHALIGGIAYGGYARKIVGRVLSSMRSQHGLVHIEDYPEHLLQALANALDLVGTVKCYDPWKELPSVAGIINPGAEGFQKLFFGQEEIAIPVHSTVEAACTAHPTAEVFINFASFRSAAASSMAALKQPTVRVVAIIAEGIPEADTKQLIAYARANNKVVIGPATVGGIQAGAFKIGETAGTIDNIIACKLYRTGSVGFVSKSGGMSNELYNAIARVTDGIYEGIAIGGDVFPGSTLSDHVKIMVVLVELGGRDEYSLVEALKQGKVNKPVVAWVSGTCARLFKSKVQFGHAGAKSGGEMESAQAKNQALKDAGAVVPTSYEAFETAIKETFEKLVDEGKITPVKEFTPPQIPEDLNIAIKSGKVRAPTHIISTISDERGEEPCYAGVPMSSIVEQGYGVGDVISPLWLKRSLPRYCTHFMEFNVALLALFHYPLGFDMHLEAVVGLAASFTDTYDLNQICIMLCADHGPCVSGAHNTIVTARAGKDLVSSLVSGLLTIGPRFGGAIDDASRYFKDAYDKGLTPYEFVEGMKKKGIRVPRIGHSETYTLSKANNLVLNIDGAIGSLFLDLLAGSRMFTKPEIEEIVGIGYLNGLFLLARSIGLIGGGSRDPPARMSGRDHRVPLQICASICYINAASDPTIDFCFGHTFDQKRLKQPLYRHPWEDVLYTK
ncbi:hypothetical protein H0E87_019256 [Populus deltoides]|uniref:ATP citrate synthase n=2 Tax=Populus TaxID=3689 RepID=A0A8T2XU85_POPDE|nr:hypothetical protein H0E87_019256 [Populus deltoides]